MKYNLIRSSLQLRYDGKQYVELRPDDYVDTPKIVYNRKKGKFTHKILYFDVQQLDRRVHLIGQVGTYELYQKGILAVRIYGAMKSLSHYGMGLEMDVLEIFTWTPDGKREIIRVDFGQHKMWIDDEVVLNKELNNEAI